jgi:hypothetical protein
MKYGHAKLAALAVASVFAFGTAAQAQMTVPNNNQTTMSSGASQQIPADCTAGSSSANCTGASGNVMGRSGTPTYQGAPAAIGNTAPGDSYPNQHGSAPAPNSDIKGGVAGKTAPNTTCGTFNGRPDPALMNCSK